MVVELLNEFEPQIKSLTLIPSSGGVFEVTVSGQLLFSKASLQRHAESGEITRLIKKYLKDRSI